MRDRVQSASLHTAILMCATFFAAGLLIAALGPSLPALAIRLEINVATLGGLLTLFSVGVMLAQAVSSRASRVFGPQRTLAVSMVVMGAGGAAIAQGQSLLVILGAAMLSGVGFGGVLATGNNLIAQVFAASSAAALNGINLFFGIGSIIGPVLTAAASAQFGAPQLAVLIGAGLLALLAPIMLLSTGTGPAVAQRYTVGSAVITLQRSLPFGLLLLVYTGIEIGFGAWLTLYMRHSTTLDEAQATLVASGFWLALTSGRGIAAILGVRVSAQRLLYSCLGGLLLGAGLLALSVGDLWPTVVAVALFGLSCGPIFPTVIALVTTSDPSGAAVGHVLLLGNAGGLLIPALIGLLLAQVGPLAVAGLLVAAALILVVLGIRAMQAQRASEQPLGRPLDPGQQPKTSR